MGERMRIAIWLTIIIMCVAIPIGAMRPASAQPTLAVPACRLDVQMAPVVHTAVQWGIQTLTANGTPFPYDHVAVNPVGIVAPRTLSVFLVKDAGTRTLDPAGCILPTAYFLTSSRKILADGPCVATNLASCKDEDRQYMALRLGELARFQLDDTRTGYENAGACYMTNLHACLEGDSAMVAEATGPRDALSVKGTCLTDSKNATIRCSAGALKMLMSVEAVQANAPTLSLLQVLGHELGHLAAGQSAGFYSSDNVLDLASPSADKVALINKLCVAGDSMRKIERDADTIGLSISKQWLPEIRRLSPEGGTISWRVTQALHHAGNLTRWNNGWSDGPAIEVARAFQTNQQKTLREFNTASGKYVGFPGPAEARLEAQRYLCGLNWARTGNLDIMIQSGSTHGSLAERMGATLSALRALGAAPDSPAASLELMIAKIFDMVLEKDRQYLNEVEGAVCSLIEQPLDCSAKEVLAPSVFSSKPGAVRMPLRFTPKGDYKESTGRSQVLIMSIGSYANFASMEQAEARGKQFVLAYSALLSQIDAMLREHGGYWLMPPGADVVAGHDRDSGGYTASIALRALVRVPEGFSEQSMPALRTIRTWSNSEGVHLKPWDEARYGVVAYFYPPGPARGGPSPTVGVMTVPLALGDIFDLDAARTGKQPGPGKAMRELIPFLRARLDKNFSEKYTMSDKGSTGAFFVRLPTENLSFPDSWAALSHEAPAPLTDYTSLGVKVARAFTQGGPDLDVALIFRGSTP
jgi:hypothetical protein